MKRHLIIFNDAYTARVAAVPTQHLERQVYEKGALIEVVPHNARAVKKQGDLIEVCDLETEQGKLIGVPYYAFTFAEPPSEQSNEQ